MSLFPVQSAETLYLCDSSQTDSIASITFDQCIGKDQARLCLNASLILIQEEKNIELIDHQTNDSLEIYSMSHFSAGVIFNRVQFLENHRIALTLSGPAVLGTKNKTIATCYPLNEKIGLLRGKLSGWAQDIIVNKPFDEAIVLLKKEKNFIASVSVVKKKRITGYSSGI